MDTHTTGKAGMRKHRRAGHSSNVSHFTGKKAGKRKRKQKKTHK